MHRSTLRVGVIGCGAVVERFHLPALAALGIKPRLLVDVNQARLCELATTFEVKRTTDDYRSYLDEVDAAIVAAPHHLHAPVSIDLLQHGIHVLVEKPMALTESECCSMIAAAEHGKAVLAVGLLRRFLHTSRWVQALLADGVLGPIESVDFREGDVYSWPVTSSFFFSKRTAGGGVLIDTGAHTIDLLCWWCGDASSVDYCDDSYGGVEADCLLNLSLVAGARGTVELSRTRTLRNSAIVRGRRGEIQVDLRGNRILAAPNTILKYRDQGYAGDRLRRQTFADLFHAELEDWLRAIESGEPPRVSGADAARSIALIERCYQQRRAWELPWVNPSSGCRSEALGVRGA